MYSEPLPLVGSQCSGVAAVVHVLEVAVLAGGEVVRAEASVMGVAVQVAARGTYTQPY